MPGCYISKRGYQLECDKPLRRGEGLAGSQWHFFLLCAF